MQTARVRRSPTAFHLPLRPLARATALALLVGASCWPCAAQTAAAGSQPAKPAAPAVASAGQQSTSPPAGSPTTTLSIQARLVTLPVTVRDKKGRIVSGLTMQNFTLVEDGRPQVIKYLNVDTNLPLTLGLLVDTSGSLRDALDRERTASKSFVEAMLSKPQDKAFLLHFDREVELLEDLTASKDKLERALDGLGPTGSSSATGSGPDDTQGSNGPRRGGMGSGGTTLYDAIYLASDELMRKQTGRKALVLFSDGDDRGSKETLTSAIEAAQRAETSVYAVYFKGEDHGGGFNPMNNGGGRRGGMGGGYPGGGYPGGRGGGGQRPSDEEAHVDGKKIMAQLAGETGGWFFEAKKKENLDEIYAAIAEQLRTQYVLGYTPDGKSAETEGFHKVQLTVDKKDLSVQTRPGYYATR